MKFLSILLLLTITFFPTPTIAEWTSEINAASVTSLKIESRDYAKFGTSLIIQCKPTSNDVIILINLDLLPRYVTSQVDIFVRHLDGEKLKTKVGMQINREITIARKNVLQEGGHTYESFIDVLKTGQKINITIVYPDKGLVSARGGIFVLDGFAELFNKKCGWL